MYEVSLNKYPQKLLPRHDKYTANNWLESTHY